MIVSTVVRSLKTGMTTDKTGSAGTAGDGPRGAIESENVPHGLSAGKRLVVVAPNWLGDAVMALPAIADLRGQLACTIAVAARRSIAPMFTLVPGIDRVVTLDGGASDVERLREGRFDAALLLPNSFRSAWVAWRAGVGERYGSPANARQWLLSRAVDVAGDMHQGERYQRLVGGLGLRSGPLTPRLGMPPAVRDAGVETLRRAGWNRQQPLVALAPGAAYGGAKRWPAARFAALAGALAADGVRTVLVGSRQDAERTDVSAFQRPDLGNGRGPIQLMGQTDLPTLGGVLASCRALVSNDSGAMHFAAALGVPVTAIFGPTDETETGPLASRPDARPVVVTHDVWCRPCMLRECPLVHRCMRGITVEAVLPSVTAHLEHSEHLG
jgi:heptosyltransferase-2